MNVARSVSNSWPTCFSNGTRDCLHELIRVAINLATWNTRISLNMENSGNSWGILCNLRDLLFIFFGYLLKAGRWLPSLLSYSPHWSVLSLPLQRSIVLPISQIVEPLYFFLPLVDFPFILPSKISCRNSSCLSTWPIHLRFRCRITFNNIGNMVAIATVILGKVGIALPSWSCALCQVLSSGICSRCQVCVCVLFRLSCICSRCQVCVCLLFRLSFSEVTVVVCCYQHWSYSQLSCQQASSPTCWLCTDSKLLCLLVVSK